MWIRRIRFATFMSLALIALEAIAIMVIFDLPALAHEAPPAVIDITRVEADRLEFLIEVPPAEFLARVAGGDHEDFETLPAADLTRAIAAQTDALVDSLTLIGPTGTLVLASKGMDQNGSVALIVLETAAGDPLSLSVSETLGPSLVRRVDPETGAALATHFLQPGDTLDLSETSAQGMRAADVFVDYIIAGFDHILPKGLDHILFVIGLFLLTPVLRPHLVQVGLFTLAHTVTLGLAATGWISVSPDIVEPLIAASIAFVAIENLFRTSLSRWRPWVVFAFGLLHGLGFAGVLSDFGLPAEQFAIALVAFNIGVEIGQLTVLALCFAAVGLFFGRPWYRKVIAIPASVILAGFGVLWFVERVSGVLA